METAKSTKPKRASNPETKAWRLLRDLMDDDEKFFMLKTRGEPVEVNGSKGGRYFLYPDGKVAMIRKDKLEKGQFYFNSSMPRPDVLATAFIYITKKEEDLIRNWGCGNISVQYKSNEEISPETANIVERHNYKTDSIIPSFFPLLLLIPFMLILGGVIFQGSGPVASITNSTSPFTIPFPTDLLDSLPAIAILAASIMVIGKIIREISK